jgi:hypothetical protein
VPIFNAVGQHDLVPDNIPNLDKLPEWHKSSEEIPTGTLALVGYTASQYADRQQAINLALNLQWVAILAEV